MATLEQIGAKMGTLQGNIDSNNVEIGRLEKSYNSLLQLKGKVERQREVFYSAKRSKENALTAVGAVSKNSIVAKNYYNGMKKLLSETGNKITNIVFALLLEKIKNELNSIRNKISSCEQNIRNAERSLERAKKDYKKEKERLNNIKN